MLFSINRTPDAFHSVKNQASNPLGILGGGYEDIPLLEPHPGTGTIDVVNKFAWTKTRSIEEQHQKVPTLYLEEMYVTAPAFVSNFKRAVETLKNISQGIEGTIPQNIIQLITAVPEQLLNSVNSPNIPYKDPRSIREYIDSIGAFDTLDVGEEKYKYMNPYKSFYGVKDTRFRYRLPYFTDTLKKVSNNFDKGAFESFKDRLVGKLPENLGGLFSSGFGIDFAKMYNYKDDGPETTITFYLDNTYDSFTGSWKSPNSYQQNWEFIFLLLYQNLPAKVNTLLVQPPVIYSARVPGVFRYLYSYISSLNVECMGNRYEKKVAVSEQTYVAPGENRSKPTHIAPGETPRSYSAEELTPEIADPQQNPEQYFNGMSSAQILASQGTTVPGPITETLYTTLIPEAYKITITLKSLLPETKNLFLYGLEDKMSNINIRKSNYKLVPDDRKLTKEEDLGDLAGYTPAFVPPATIAYHSEYPGDIENSFTYKGYQDVGGVQGGGVDPLQSGG